MANGSSALKTGPSTIAKVWYFVRHWLEMCAAMCIGTAVLTPLYTWAFNQFGYANASVQFPVTTVLVITFNMTLPMVIWMRIRGMKWGPINEMSAAMVIEAALLIGLYWLGTIPGSSLLALQHGLMMPIMLVPMLLRPSVYTGKHCH